MRIAAVLLSLLVAGGIGCKRHRADNSANPPVTKPVERTGDQSTTRSTSDYPPGGVEGQPAQPAGTGTTGTGTTGTGASGTGPGAMPATGTGENATGTGAGTTDSMGTPATGATSDGGVNQQRRSGTGAQGTGTQGTQGTGMVGARGAGSCQYQRSAPLRRVRLRRRSHAAAGHSGAS